MGNLWNIINRNVTIKLEQKCKKNTKIVHNKIRKLPNNTQNNETKKYISQTHRKSNLYKYIHRNSNQAFRINFEI